ncbi:MULTISPECIES: response regulator transcription factor [Sphingomonas]|uniref:response regulator transcription factor n=1 Tax=Sphingomonas TaxID=13687 RepID=UPI000DEEF615|nr:MULTISPECIES: response regulator [Sphingomonas]
MSKRAYVVDDDGPFRKSMLLLLETAGWLVRGFESASQFLEECLLLPPGALLLDVRMPGHSGLDLLENEGVCLANFATIIVTGHGDVETAVRSLKSGAVDFIEKPFSGADLLTMLENSYAHLLSSVEFAKRERTAAQQVANLTSRELDVLRGLLAGASHKTIGRHFGISDRTVEMYRNNMVRKLGARSTNEAIHVGIMARLEPARIERNNRD